MSDILLPILEPGTRNLAPGHLAPGTDRPKVYVETYGCQMNISDSEIVLGVLHKSGYDQADRVEDADVVLLNTCAIRENAENKINERLNILGYHKRKRGHMVVGVLGCMAERLRHDLLEKNIVDLVVGPDEYRRVPELVSAALGGDKGIAVKLSRVETYDDIEPLRTEGISAWVSIMRGCDKFCTFCVVPFTRGRERSRDLPLITDELKRLWDTGFREVTLLGQNVNSYIDENRNADFADLLIASAKAVPEMRIRYTTSHPQDMTDKVIEAMAEYDNICKYIHLPFQSGSDRILQLMNRTYTIEHYLGRIRKIKELMPNCALSTDIIAGFCTETEEDHQATIDLLNTVRYEGAYMFAYSPRENTKAWKMGDDVPEEVKIRRLTEIIDLQNEIARQLNEAEVGNTHKVMVEGPSKRNPLEWKGRTDTNKTVIFPHEDQRSYIVGDVVNVKVDRTSSATLFGSIA
ncbi:MAG: tRNA (N6-isopentenyl adenosine(37)-C2)-methylthiotransferase MiaB [Ignavibacteriae bacterium]|nr:MAG: tRNA (N6-isopentenyl adenosine(37)-C2)-methylthiotransferase MiaB [Ignavibacteriota bacterium]RPI69971.1 MAG: tRNA (N6-isopentenyl adenosine(37)-C2)-methylthiotransferase MiaB [Ignavibacteriota bacterium]